MKKLYLPGVLFLVIIVSSLLPKITFSQACNTITAIYFTDESRCAASGSISIKASGGSGNYEYMVSGPITTTFTANNVISSLPPGTYSVSIKDLVLNCVYSNDSVTVDGNYIAPLFKITATDASCTGIADGTITASNVRFGRPPYSFEIIAPSASGIGTVSTSGNFTGLAAGSYFIQLTDSCGTAVVRTIAIQNQNINCCGSLGAAYVTAESRCEATGTVQINAFGGSGNYQYKVTGPVSTAYTSSNLISGLSPGRYLVTVLDIITNCEYAKDSITIDGDYVAPSFSMVATDVTCINGQDGTITVTSQQL